ncbi:hypothetical protein [Bacillus sp. USDA818B3_A]|uniref:hypothetical protein n=1 Tax=Bacillus sp. USDA818B3_A TaxID=2698834 RepID=UPI00136DE7ED|nr:hypothetical protein [Bacillus sp. USDA818B3_A]
MDLRGIAYDYSLYIWFWDYLMEGKTEIRCIWCFFSLPHNYRSPSLYNDLLDVFIKNDRLPKRELGHFFWNLNRKKGFIL